MLKIKVNLGKENFMFADIMLAHEFSGTILVTQNNDILFEYAAGLANRETQQPIQLDTIFNMGSMNKMFTAVAVLQLIEAGQATWDEPIAHYLGDEFPEALGQKITPHHLVTHRAGLQSYLAHPAFGEDSSQFMSAQALMPLIAEEELLFEPDTDFSYSNSGMLVAGRIVERLSGQDFPDYAQINIFNPAQMTRTGFFSRQNPRADMAIGYVHMDADGEPIFDEDKPVAEIVANTPFVSTIGTPAGGACSTVADMTNFWRALAQGQLVQNPAELWTGVSLRQPDMSYCRGFQEFRKYTKLVFGHGGGGPGVHAFSCYIPENDVCLAIFANIYGHTLQIRSQILDVLTTL